MFSKRRELTSILLLYFFNFLLVMACVKSSTFTLGYVFVFFISVGPLEKREKRGGKRNKETELRVVLIRIMKSTKTKNTKKQKKTPLSSNNVDKKKAKHKKTKSDGAAKEYTPPATNSNWLDALVKKNLTNESSSTSTKNAIKNNRKGTVAAVGVVSNKAERIKKRQEKRNRREARKNIQVQSKSPSSDNALTLKNRNDVNNGRLHAEYFAQQRKRLLLFSEELESIVEQIQEKYSHSKKYTKLYVPPDAKIKGKAVTLTKNRKLTSESIQPRKNDYGGIGLARPSLLLPLDHPSFIPLLETEFKEHINGFYGRANTKSMKKQLDGNMLWRKLLKEKQERDSIHKA